MNEKKKVDMNFGGRGWALVLMTFLVYFCSTGLNKGELYANDPAFKSRRAFMQTTFLAQNKGGEGFPEYDYLYLQEDKGGQWQGIFVDEINKFFKE